MHRIGYRPLQIVFSALYDLKCPFIQILEMTLASTLQLIRLLGSKIIPSIPLNIHGRSVRSKP